jgi:hypothetical protein
MGLYTGEEYLVINYYPSRFGQFIALSYPVYQWRKGLRAIYTGGLAYNGTKSIYAITSTSGILELGKYVLGAKSGAVGIITTVATKHIEIDNLYGKFLAGETVTMQDTEFAIGTSSASTTLTATSEDDTEIVFASNITSTFTVGKYVKGLTSGCLGVITATDNNSYLKCNWIYNGVAQKNFIIGETITQTDTIGGTTSSTTLVIDAIAQRALCESHPDITRACEIELRYMIKHQYDFENQSTMKDQTSRRPDLVKYELQPETIALLSSYKRYL